MQFLYHFSDSKERVLICEVFGAVVELYLAVGNLTSQLEP